MLIRVFSKHKITNKQNTEGNWKKSHPEENNESIVEYKENARKKRNQKEVIN